MDGAAKRNVNTFVSGKSGKGKSWEVGFLIEQSTKARVIWDLKNEHGGLASHAVTLDAARWRAMEAKGPSRVWPDFLASYPSIRIRTFKMTPDQIRIAVASCAAVVHERGRTLWAASEYHILAPNKNTPEATLILHTDARTCQNDIIADSQRPGLVDTTIMSQPNRRIGFGMDDPNDIKRTAGYFRAVPCDVAAAQGVPISPADRKAGIVPAARVLPHLAPRRALYLNCDTDEQILLDTNTQTRLRTHGG
jgi:hypothetical protein